MTDVPSGRKEHGFPLIPELRDGHVGDGWKSEALISAVDFSGGKVYFQLIKEGVLFADRKEAGARLAERLSRYENQKDALVLALPRGGVVTGFEVSRLLGLPLDVIIVRKIGFPGQPELAAGAVSETGAVVVNPFAAAMKNIKALIEAETERQREEISRRVELYRKGGRLPPLEGRTIILVDDGAATGATIKAAITTLKKDGVGRLVVALPVAPPETARELAETADELVCLETPVDFMAVGNYYGDFKQVSDREVMEILEKK